MRKFYTLLIAVLFISVTTASADNIRRVSSEVEQSARKVLEPVSSESQPGACAFWSELNIPVRQPADRPMADDTETWKSIGTGTFVEGPMDIFSSLNAGDKWEIEIFESEQTAGRYRFVPYNANSPLAAQIGYADNNYMIVNAQDPEKVYTEPISVYSYYDVEQLVPENEWSDFSVYGTLSDGCISFPAKSHAVYSSGWYFSNVDGKFKIYLPGAEVLDYSVNISTDFCADDNMISFTITTGSSTASLKTLILGGDYSDEVVYNYTNITNYGSAAEADVPYSFVESEAGIYTIMVGAFDASGVIQDASAVNVFILDDDQENWSALDGTATFTETFISIPCGDTPATYSVPVEKDLVNEGRYRLVNPYQYHPSYSQYALSHSGHNHYLYINAADPTGVYVEASSLGVDAYNAGVALAYSPGDPYLADGSYTIDQLKGYNYPFGTMDGLTITFPASSLITKFYGDNAMYLNSSAACTIVLPESAGIDGITADADADAPVEYYNLQGVKVAGANLAPGFYVIRQGSKAKKIFVTK